MCKHDTLRFVELRKPQSPLFSYNKLLESFGSRLECVDECIAPLVQVLNDYGIETISSCCVHGKTSHSSVWIDPRHIKFKSLGFTKKFEKMLLKIGIAIINFLVCRKCIEVALVFPYGFCQKNYQNLTLPNNQNTRKKWDTEQKKAYNMYKTWTETTERGKHYYQKAVVDYEKPPTVKERMDKFLRCFNRKNFKLKIIK